MNFAESDEFKKEFKKLSKKYRTLEQDFEILKRAITASPTGNGTKHWNVLKQGNDELHILKVRMMCRAVKGSQFRVIYIFDGKKIEVLFIELYFKGNKAIEDSKRIEEYLKQLDS